MNAHELIETSGLYTDLYQLAMGQAYYLDGVAEKPAVFDYFFRTIPYGGGYVLFAGLEPLIEVLENLKFYPEDLAYLRKLNFREEYVDFLASFTFRAHVYAVNEGEVIFPLEPIIRVEGRLFEAQLVETLILNLVNYQSLIATKAARMRHAAGSRILSDFGLRRAPAQGGMLAARAAVIGGFDSTSNVKAAQVYGLEPAGTMAHSFIESYDDELEAYLKFVEANPDRAVLLVDTYDTLLSGTPHAVEAAKRLQKKGIKLKGIRLDSGDLSYLSKKAREMLDRAGLEDVKIVASNLLDEYVIKSLIDQGAPVDVFGVGTRLVTGFPDAALDGVYKLSVYDGKPRMKISDNLTKTTLPGKKQVARFTDHRGMFMADVIHLEEEAQVESMFHPYEREKTLSLLQYEDEPLLKPVMIGGRRVGDRREVKEICEYAKERLARLPQEHRRFENPHIYKVGLSEKLMALRSALMERHRKSFWGGKV